MNTVINLLPWIHPENEGKLEAVNVQVFKEEATQGKIYVAFELQWQGEKIEGLLSRLLRKVCIAFGLRQQGEKIEGFWTCWIPDDLEKVSLGLAAWIEPVLVAPSAEYFPMLTDPLWIKQWLANGTLKQV